MSDVTEWMSYKIAERINRSRKLVRSSMETLRVARELIKDIPDPAAQSLRQTIETMLKVAPE